MNLLYSLTILITNLIYLIDMKKSWIILIIVFLLTTNVALLATLIISQNDNRSLNDRRFDGRINNITGLGRHQNDSFMEEIAEELEMSPKQLEQLNALSQEFHESKRGFGRRMNEMKHQYFIHILFNNPDEDLLNNLADSLGKLYAYRIQLDYNHYQNIKSICTPEQIEKFDSLGKHHIHKRQMRNSRGCHMNSNRNNQ